MCQNTLMFGASKNVWIGRFSDIAIWLRMDCDDDPSTVFIDRCRNVDLAAVSIAPFFYPYLKSCALHRDTEIVALFQRAAASPQRTVRAKALAIRTTHNPGPLCSGEFVKRNILQLQLAIGANRAWGCPQQTTPLRPSRG